MAMSGALAVYCGDGLHVSGVVRDCNGAISQVFLGRAPAVLDRVDSVAVCRAVRRLGRVAWVVSHEVRSGVLPLAFRGVSA